MVDRGSRAADHATVRLGHKRKDVDDIYSHITDQMVEETLDALQLRWERDGGWSWKSYADPEREVA
jgi:hypothetical protein